MNEEFKYMVSPLVFGLKLNIECEGKSDIIEEVYGIDSDYNKNKNTELMNVNTLFPSPTDDDGDTKGGVIIVKLKKMHEYNISISCKYKDKTGKQFSNKQNVSFDNNNNDDKNTNSNTNNNEDNNESNDNNANENENNTNNHNNEGKAINDDINDGNIRNDNANDGNGELKANNSDIINNENNNENNEDNNSNYFDNNGIRKAILLIEYVKLLEKW
eukprot:CAMPEP_0114657594 /NCGR_PEP_ID=MMETSP0191-20121206/14197_1 /TAXON_ID=126664 /ORGANISM="Sorites sp." /LENGTH=215 /DNA_ID=CAMNT_0001877359 /DNA_START=1379 /DNA_END=2023 /DNA_ORIENTATION=+